MIALAYLIFCIFPPLGLLYFVAGIFNNPSNWRRYLPFLVYILFIGAYVFMPSSYEENLDLVRYIPEIEAYGRLSLREAIQRHGDILYARDLFFWIFGQLHVPHLVPAFSVAIIYSIAGYITCDTADRYNSTKYIGWVLLFQMAMIPYISLINNIRNVLSFSLITLAAYLDIIRGKRNGWVLLLYMTGIMMHLSAVVFLVFRFLSRICRKCFEPVMLFPVVFSSLIFALYDNRARLLIGGSLGSTIQRIIIKLYGYLTDTSSDYAVKSLTSTTFLIDRYIMIVGMIMTLIIIYYGIKSKGKICEDDKRIFAFVGMIAVMALACNVFAMPNYWRFSSAMYIVVGVMLIPYLNKYRRLPDLIKIIFCGFLLLGPFGLFIQIWKYRSFDFANWGTDILLTNVLTILWDVVEGIIAI